LTDEILNFFGTDVGQFTLIPASGGVFEVTLNSELIFSKKELARFPEEGEVIRLLKERLS
jgi:selenoprotein W-related protein